jgi:VanZ family protein
VERETSPLRTWLPVLIWTMIIILESTLGSAANTGSLLHELARWMFGYVNQERLESSHHFLRKAGHFWGYGILGYLWFRAFLRTSTGISQMTCVALAITSSFLTASLDELNQSFSPGRAAQVSDVILDTSGALVLASFAFIAAARHRRSNCE